jgi:hypothetical protein
MLQGFEYIIIFILGALFGMLSYASGVKRGEDLAGTRLGRLFNVSVATERFRQTGEVPAPPPKEVPVR